MPHPAHMPHFGSKAQPQTASKCIGVFNLSISEHITSAPIMISVAIYITVGLEAQKMPMISQSSNSTKQLDLRKPKTFLFPHWDRGSVILTTESRTHCSTAPAYMNIHKPYLIPSVSMHPGAWCRCLACKHNRYHLVWGTVHHRLEDCTH